MGSLIDARKFAISSAPYVDRIDSGWNCTPSSGSDRWRTPITTPSSDHAVATSDEGRGRASEW